jgi:subtilisin family serine protease
MPQKASPSLYARLESLQDGDTVEVNIFLKDQPATVLLASEKLLTEVQGPVDAVDRMRSDASISQRALVSYLQGAENEFVSLNETLSIPKAIVKDRYWVNNSVTAEVTGDVLKNILGREDVEYVELRSNVQLQDMLDAEIVSDHETGPASPAVPAPDSASAFGGAAEPSSTIKRIGAPLMWKEGLTGEGIIVAVIDSGVNYDHPDLKSHMWDGGEEFPNHGFDVVDPDNDPRDDDDNFKGHGTACAGIVAGDGTSGEATGVAPKATIMAIRVRNEESALKSIELALRHRPHVISMSFSKKHVPAVLLDTPIPEVIEPDSPRWRRACESIFIAGVLHANSAGNNGNDLQFLNVPRNIGSPADCPPPNLHALQILRGGVSSVISCGATTDADELLKRSSNGPVAWNLPPFSDYPFDSNGQKGLIKPDICAPGPGSRSCNFLFDGSNGQSPYIDFGDTSAAAAHIGGCLALLAQACVRSGKPIVPASIQEALEVTAVPIKGQTQAKENNFGAGRVDVYQAYLYGKDPARKWWD